MAGRRPRPVVIGLLLVVAMLGASVPAAWAGRWPGSTASARQARSHDQSGTQVRQAAATSANLAPSNLALTSVASFPDLSVAAMQNSALPGSIANDWRLLVGGVGSDLWRSPTDPAGEFWMVTDRGPNGQMKVDGENRRTFPVPEYTPHILRVKLDGESVTVLDGIPIVGQSGQPVTGLPNVEGHEAPFAFDGQTRLAYNPSGLDVEGLVRTPSGKFWAVEEYGPSLVHIDARGKVLRRFVPQGLALDGADYPIVANLPGILSMRAQNRGFEGLTLSPDGRTLYLAIQGPLAIPDEKSASRSRVVRVLAFDVASEQVSAEYAYPIGWIDEAKAAAKAEKDAARPEKAAKPEAAAKPRRAARAEAAASPVAPAKPERVAKPEKAAKPSTEATRISALAPVGGSKLLVLERTSDDARLYLVDLNEASNLLGSRWDDPATSPALEGLDDLAAGGVQPLVRTLMADLSTLPDMPEKIEGLAILDATTVVLANDNDFDMGTFDQHGQNVGQGVKSQLLMVTLPTPLP